MRQFTLKFIVFIGLSLAVYFSMFFLLNISVNGKKIIYYTSNYYAFKGGAAYQSFKEFDKNKKYDILILGSSHAYRGYDPRIFFKNGYLAYNLGTSGQSILNTYDLAVNYITSNNNKLIIIDIFSGTFSGDDFESSSNLITNIPDVYLAEKIALSLRDIRGVNMFVQRLFSGKQPPSFVDNGYVGSGFCEKKDSIKGNVKYTHGEIVSAQKSLISFEELLFFCKKNNFNVVFVSHPMPKEYSIVAYNHFAEKLKPIIDKYNYRWYDFSFNHNLNSKNHFFDHNHLNQAGVLIFDSLLIEKLKADHYLN